MARTHKVQTMHEYHSGNKQPDSCSGKPDKQVPFFNTGAGYRYGNNRHMWAKLKVTERKIERRKNNRLRDED